MMGVRPQRLDVLFAFKAIALTEELTGAEKRVAAAIVDSFNYRTTQCDPSLNRVAHLLGISRRTVIRAVVRLERLRFLLKKRHGGHSLRNSYEPNWVRYREIESTWSSRKRTKHWKSAATEVSPYQSQTRHLDSGADGTQTCLINQSKQAVCIGTTSNECHSVGKGQGSGRSKSSREGVSDTKRSLHPSRTAAERRWNADLNERFVGDPEVYAALIGAIDADMQIAATDAELHGLGGGLLYILHNARDLEGVPFFPRTPPDEVRHDSPAKTDIDPQSCVERASDDKADPNITGGRGV
jgi:hypothetical protein